MFYHIRIDYFDTKLKANQTLYSTDITDFNTILDKASTYMRGDNFLFAGTKLKNEDIRHFRVYKSDYDIENCMQIGDSRISPNVIWAYTTETILGEKGLCPEITEEVFSDVKAKLSLVASSNATPAGKSKGSASSRNVFIVHGHNKAIRTETELLIKKLGYNPIVLFKQPDGGATIIEKLERETADIAFSIILYTYCDDGKSKEEEHLRHRARQNVVFEHGMMCGLLGRKKVLALLESGVEMPGDLSGIVYKTIDEAGHWQIEVAREMKAAGLDIDINRLI